VLAVGPSGAGKSLKTNLLASEILGTANPYAVGGTHRHIPEIQQALAAAGARPASRSRRCSCRWPRHPCHLHGADRGRRDGCRDPLGLGERVRRRDVRAAAARGAVPRTADVLGANTALVGLAIDRAANRVVVVTAVDNLVKGTAGAAIQSMNIALGLPEATGLTVNGVAP
jgi:N-acetyl-gamma-glutamyl-phosphate reductase